MESRSSFLRGKGIHDGLFLTGANLVAAAGNYAFQALMRRHLPWAEFGYMNATLSLILCAGLPLTAASQTLTHHLAQIRATGDTEKMRRLQAGSLNILRRLTWILFAAALMLLYPVSQFLHFPRMALAWIALLWIPINLWSALGGAWCTGLGRFRLLSLLLIATALVRLISGALISQLYPWAEAGVIAGVISGIVMASVVIFGRQIEKTPSLPKGWLDRDLLRYGFAALAVSFGSFVFLQGDQIVAQRYFSGDELGRYSGAGLLGRTIIWGSLPVLTVYFTRRSGHDPVRPSSAPLLFFYFLLIAIGACLVLALRMPLQSLLLGSHDLDIARLSERFVLTMLLIGVLQAVGCHYLAARRHLECLAFGLCGMLYLIVLLLRGVTPLTMLTSMAGMAAASLLVLAIVSLIQRNPRHVKK